VGESVFARRPVRPDNFLVYPVYGTKLQKPWSGDRRPTTSTMKTTTWLCHVTSSTTRGVPMTSRTMTSVTMTWTVTSPDDCWRHRHWRQLERLHREIAASDTGGRCSGRSNDLRLRPKWTRNARPN